jgi:hypothetical protein
VLWVRVDSRESLLADSLHIAHLLQLSLSQDQDQQQVLQGVKQWLNAHGDWLLILDDVEDLQLLDDILPQNIGGHVILTTRASFVGTAAHALEIEKMSLVEGMLFLLRRAKKIGSNDPLEKASEQDRKMAQELVTLMDGLPLALDQAGAYVGIETCIRNVAQNCSDDEGDCFRITRRPSRLLSLSALRKLSRRIFSLLNSCTVAHCFIQRVFQRRS